MRYNIEGLKNDSFVVGQKCAKLQCSVKLSGMSSVRGDVTTYDTHNPEDKEYGTIESVNTSKYCALLTTLVHPDDIDLVIQKFKDIALEKMKTWKSYIESDLELVTNAIPSEFDKEVEKSIAYIN